MKTLKIVGGLLVVLAAYLLLWPTKLEPKSWTPPVSPGFTGDFAYNEKLKGIEVLAKGQGVGPEAVAVDAAGSVYTGFIDGRVMQYSADGSVAKELVNTGGRPLGIALGPNNSLFIADAFKGLLQFDQGKLKVLSTTDGVLPFGFPDDADWRAGDNGVYFSDASWKYGFGHHTEDAIEHGALGRLLRYDLETGKTQVLMRNVQFANGVAIGPGGDYVLVNSTTEYKILRYWLKGPKAGTYDVFIENLPGFPDNITFNGKDRFWVAIFGPRDPLLDQMLPGGPLMRKVIGRLPAFLQPKPALHAFALGLDLDGKVVANLQYMGSADDTFGPITSVREAGEWLYFGSLSYSGFGRIRLADVSK